MKGHFYKPNCKCVDKKRCKCKATWSYVIDTGTPSARRQVKKGGFRTKKDAELAAAAVQVDVRNGSYIVESDILFSDFVAEWLILYTDTGRAKESTVRVRRHESGRLSQIFKGLKLKAVSRKLYQSALTELKLSGLADRTLTGIHCTGRMLFKKAFELNYLKSDPTEFAIVPRTQQSVEEAEREVDIPKYLERAELSTFLKAAREQESAMDGPIFVTLAYTGLRVGELCALKWKDLNFTDRTLSITKTLYSPTNNARSSKLLTPKTKSSRRVLDIDAAVVAELEAHRMRQNIFRMEHRDTYQDMGYIFANMSKLCGYPSPTHTVRRAMKRLLQKAGLDKSLSPHSLRHTHTSLMAEAGVSLEEIMDRLGHASDITTRRVYLHVTKAMKSDASRKFSELMSGI